MELDRGCQSFIVQMWWSRRDHQLLFRCIFFLRSEKKKNLINNNLFFAGLAEIAELDLLLAFLREIDRQ